MLTPRTERCLFHTLRNTRETEKCPWTEGGRASGVRAAAAGAAAGAAAAGAAAVRVSRSRKFVGYTLFFLA